MKMNLMLVNIKHEEKILWECIFYTWNMLAFCFLFKLSSRQDNWYAMFYLKNNLQSKHSKLFFIGVSMSNSTPDTFVSHASNMIIYIYIYRM